MKWIVPFVDFSKQFNTFKKKYIADLELYFNKDKIINFYKQNNILFSDTLSPNILILSGYNFDGIKNQDDEDLLNSPFIGMGVQILGDWF